MKNYWLVAFVLMFLVLPTMAQEDTDANLAPIQVEISGVLSYEDNNGDGFREVLVGGVVISPPEGFSSLDFEEGQNIRVIGYLNPDDSIDANSFFLDEAPIEATEEITPEVTSTAPLEDEDATDRAEDEEERRQEEQEREEERRQEEQEREEERRQEEQEREEERRQEEQEREEERRQNTEPLELVGEITTVTQNYIVVDSVTIEGGGVFQPSAWQVGQFVRVTGVYENNGRLRANSIQEISEEEAKLEATQEANNDSENADCIPESHPLVEILSEEFEMTVSELIALHCAGNGFGDIARALLLASETGLEAEVYLEQINSGQDWGQIIREAGFEPSVFSPERVLGGN